MLHPAPGMPRASDVKSSSLEKTLVLGKSEGKRRRGWQRMGWVDSITDSVGMDLSKLREIVQELQPWGSQSVSDIDLHRQT